MERETRRRREEEFAVGCVVEQIETDTHPQQESLTPSRRNTHTHSLSLSLSLTHTHRHIHTHSHTQTDKQSCQNTSETYPHTPKMANLVSFLLHTHICTHHTHTHTLCGLAVATADAVHEYFSQTLWQSFHLHGPDVSS